MQRPTLLEGIAVALLGSVLLGPLLLLLHSLLGGLLAWKAVVVLLTAVYLGYLVLRSRRKNGRIVLGLLALSALLGGLFFQLHLSSLILLALTLIWGIRSLAYSQSLLSAVLQGGLCLLGCGAARLMYEQSGSLALSLWGFLLLQAAFVLIPARLQGPQASRRGARPGDTPQDRFGRAQQAAVQALQRLQSGVQYEV